MLQTTNKAPTPYGDAAVDDPQTQIPVGTRPLFDYWMRDPRICIGRDGCYYLSGTTQPIEGPRHPAWVWSDGLQVWRSPDLRTWEALGLLWRLDEGPEWMRDFYVYGPDGNRVITPEEFRSNPPEAEVAVHRALWSPKIFYSKRHDNYLVACCINRNMGIPAEKWIGDRFGATFLLRSTTGEPRGPYEVTSSLPLTNCVDATLFEDDDGTLYFLWQNGMVAKLTDSLDALIDVRSVWQKRYPVEPVCEGVHLFKHDGIYHLGVTAYSWEMDGGQHTYCHTGHGGPKAATYDVIVATLRSVYGPYGYRYTSITGGGHGNHFQDRDGNWWACVFACGSDKITQSRVGFCERPALVPMRWVDGRIFPAPLTKEDGK